MRQVCVMAALALVPGCFGNMAANQAANVAAQQHNCPRDRVHVVGPGGHWQYWLDVCGRRRLYDTQDARYVDITGSLELGSAPYVRTSSVPQSSGGRVVGRTESARVRVESDEFTGESRHVFEYDFGRGRGLSIAWVTGAPHATARIDSRSPRAQFGECHDTLGLADETRITPTRVEYTSDSFGTGVVEHVSFRLTPRDLHAMTSADRVRFRVCTTVFEFPGNTDALRSFYTTIYEAAQSRAAPQPATPTPDGGV